MDRETLEENWPLVRPAERLELVRAWLDRVIGQLGAVVEISLAGEPRDGSEASLVDMTASHFSADPLRILVVFNREVFAEDQPATIAVRLIEDVVLPWAHDQRGRYDESWRAHDRERLEDERVAGSYRDARNRPGTPSQGNPFDSYFKKELERRTITPGS